MAAQHKYNIAALNALLDLIGEVQASPTSNTLLARLKDLLTGVVISAGSALIGKVGIDQTTPGTTNNVAVTTVKPDGTNAMPSLDTAARAGFVKQTSVKTETGFLAAAWPHEIAAAGSASMIGDSVAVDVSDVIVGDVLITLEGDVANAGFDALVDAEFVVSYDGTDYDDGGYQTLSFDFDGASTTRRRSIPLNVSGADAIKIKTLTNNDASFALTTATVNLYLTKKV